MRKTRSSRAVQAGMQGQSPLAAGLAGGAHAGSGFGCVAGKLFGVSGDLAGMLAD
jgi:hypothetical protein